jgi:hypothetical protein
MNGVRINQVHGIAEFFADSASRANGNGRTGSGAAV